MDEFLAGFTEGAGVESARTLPVQLHTRAGEAPAGTERRRDGGGSKGVPTRMLRVCVLSGARITGSDAVRPATEPGVPRAQEVAEGWERVWGKTGWEFPHSLMSLKSNMQL